VTEGITEFFGSLLFPLADLTPIDDNIVPVGSAIDSNGTERKLFKAH
jgi:hypothetical protein